MDPEPVGPIFPHECLTSFHTTSQGECNNSSVDCNTEFDMLEPIIVTNEPKSFNDGLKDSIAKDDEFLDSYTVKKKETISIFNSVDHNANISDNSNFDVRPLQPDTDEKKSNIGKSEQLVGLMLPSQCLPTLQTTPRSLLVDCNTKETDVQREYDNDILKDVIVIKEEKPGPFYAKIVNYFANIFKYINPNVSGRANVLDNSNIVEDSYNQIPQTTTFEQIQHEMPQVNDTTAMDNVSNLSPEDGIIEVEVQTNAMPLVKEAEYLTEVCSSLSLLPRNDVIDLTANVLDNSNFVEDSYNHIPQTATFEQIQHKMQPQVSLRLMVEDGNVEVEDLTNTMSLVKEAEYLTQMCSSLSLLPRNDVIDLTACSQDIPKETADGESYDIHNRKTTEEYDDASGSNNKEDIEIVNSHDEREKESIQSTEIQSGTLHVHNDKKSTFNVKHSLQNHKRIHKDQKLYVCQTCGKSFIRKESFKNHTYIHTGEKPYKCGLCDKIYRHRTQLWGHLKVHTGDRPHVCDTCNMSFKRKELLRNHSYTHTGERPYTCTICNKSYRQRAGLWAHSKIHSDEKPHTCGVCGKSFRFKSCLLNHSKCHDSNRVGRTYKCGSCDKSFWRKHQLLEHSYSHTGELPYICKKDAFKVAQRLKD